MRVYEVGGKVRDSMLGMASNDIDYVIVGGTHEEMIAAGYKQVGVDFSVYIDEKGIEHAFARTERKTGDGYTSFTVSTLNVTLEEDLARRDLTINAMAQRARSHPLDDGSDDGYDHHWMDTAAVIDPYKGRRDLDTCVIRHVTDAGFVEDPVRILRVARFLARFPTFDVHPDTFKLIKKMVDDGMVHHLVPDRVALELKKALSSSVPSRFFYFLQMVGALEILFPELHALIGKTQPSRHHPEGDAFVHTMLVLEESANRSDIMYRWAALVHDLGKGTSDIANLPHHYGHEDRGPALVEKMVKRFNLSNDFLKVGQFVAKYHTHVHRVFVMKASTIAKIAELSVVRDRKMIEYLCITSSNDARGRGPYYARVSYPNCAAMSSALHAAVDINLRDVMTEEEIEKASIDKRKQVLFRARTNAVSNALARFK